jgi:hypothetical protein
LSLYLVMDVKTSPRSFESRNTTSDYKYVISMEQVKLEEGATRDDNVSGGSKTQPVMK